LKNNYIFDYFELLEHQRDDFYRYLDETIKDPWERPLPDKWSVGETVYHLVLLLRLVRRFSGVYLPMMLPYAKLRRNRPYKTNIHNIYQEYTEKKTKPMKAPFVLTPPKNLSQKYHFKDIQQLLDTDTAKWKEKVTQMDEQIAGQIYYPDPVAHYPNVIQSVHLLAIHEQHHFNLVKKYELFSRENDSIRTWGDKIE